MNKKHIGLLVLSFVSMILIGCKKNDDTIHFEGLYRPVSTVNLDEVVMFSHHGQVKEASVIKAFLIKKNSLESFIFDKKVMPIEQNISTYTFDFKSDNKINIYTGDISTPHSGEIISRTSDYLDIDVKAPLFGSGFLSMDQSNRCETLASTITFPINQIENYPLPPTGSPTSAQLGLIGRIEIKNGQLFLPLINFLTSYSSDGMQCYNMASTSLKTFNKEIVKQLRVGDTIVYQSKRAKLIKQ